MFSDEEEEDGEDGEEEGEGELINNQDDASKNSRITHEELVRDLEIKQQRSILQSLTDNLLNQFQMMRRTMTRNR